MVAQALQIGQDLGLARRIERGQRLVHQQRRRAAQQGAPDRDPLALAARERARPAREQALDAEQLDHLAEPRGVGERGREPAAVQQVLAHREMGKKAAFLEHVAEPALVRGQIDAARAIEQGSAADHDPAAPRSDQAADHVDHRGLAGARVAEQRDDTAVAGKVHVDLEAADPARDLDLEAAHAAIRRARLRPSSSAPISAASDTVTAIRVRRRAPSSPPGIWIRV